MSILQCRETVRLEDLRHPEKNVRMHPERQIQELERSLDKFGQTRDLVIDETGLVLAGNGLMTAMQRRGYEEAAVIRMVGMTEADKMKFMLADNKTFTLGVEDLDGVNYVLSMLGEDLDVPGYDPSTLAALVATGEQITEKLEEYGTIDDAEIQSIRDNRDKKERLMEQPATGGADPAPGSTSDEPQAQQSADSGHEPEQGKDFVICHGCGETIWL